MKKLLLGFLLGVPLWAQTISITSPIPSQVLSGFSGFSFQVSVSSLPALYKVKYVVDAFDAAGSPSLTGGDTSWAFSSPWSLPFNSFKNLNGPHQVVATAYDALDNVLATSSAVAFTTSNSSPISCNPSLAVTTGTSLGSNWTGSVAITPTISGGCASDSKNFSWWIDGILQYTISGTGASQSLSIDTTQFANGTHRVAVSVTDDTNRANYTNGNNNQAAEWSRTVTFANSSSPQELRVSARETFLTPTSTSTLTCSLQNDDGTSSSPTCSFFSLNTSICTVGASSGVVTAVANGACNVLVMANQVSGTDLTSSGSGSGVTVVNSVSHPFTYPSGSQLLHITSGSGWTPGFYQAKNFDSATNNLVIFGIAASGGATGGNFTIGLTRSVWVNVWTDNIMPHFGKDGSLLTSYSPSLSIFAASSFSSGQAVTSDVPYTPGPISDYSSGGFNTLETGLDSSGLDVTGGTGQAAFQNIQNSYVTNLQNLVAGTKLRFSLTGDNFLNNLQNFWQYLAGTTSTWTPTGLHTLFSSWTGKANPPLWAPMKDEVNSTYDHKPLQGPITFGGGAQSGLTSIVASGGTCTANWTDWSLNGNRAFIIRNATSSGLNSTAGTVYTAGSTTANTFTFSCGAANGTYNSSSDPSLAIEPYAVAWYASNTDYLHYTAFQQLRATRNAISGAVNMSWPNAAGTTLESISNWMGNGTQSISGVSQVADANDLYWTHGGPEVFLAAYSSTNAIIQEMGDSQIRTEYGSFNPDLPSLVQAQGTVANYGMAAYPVAISSCSGNTITFGAAHGISTILNGISRLTVTGNAGCNGNFYVLSAPDSTHLTVALAQATISASGSGGTLKFSNDNYSKTLGSISVGGSPSNCGFSGVTVGGINGVLCGDTFSYTGSPDSNVNSHVGQQFTISGNSSGAINGGTYIYDSENVSVANTSTNFFRQIPSLSGSGGSGLLVPDDFYVRGRSNTGVNFSPDIQIGWGFSTVIEAAMLRAAGTRLYKFSQSFPAWASNFGFGGQWNLQQTFNDGSVSNQLFSNPHWENFNSVPNWWTASRANLFISRLAKYYFQPSLSSPDYGPKFEACAHGGASGNLLLVSNFTDGPQTLTISLSPYLQSGQAIAKLYLTARGFWQVTTLGAGTSSDTLTFAPNSVVAYLFPVAFSGEVTAPVISQNVGAVVGATHIGVQFGYDSYSLPTAATFDCGSGTTCTPPADLNVGPVFYRQVWLDSSNVPLHTSAIQSISSNPPPPSGGVSIIGTVVLE